MSRPMNAEQFLADVSNHKMAVKLDNGLYRHLLLRQPGNSNMWFEIVTWPGSLTIGGDMGSWSFSRIEDMFEFFRSGKLKINASYWCEKIDSESRFGGPAEKFDPEVFRGRVIESLDGYGLDDDRKAEIIEALKGEVFSGDQDESYLRRDVAHFKHGDFEFSDIWEISAKAYTYHFLWCLYAIVWAIQQYDAVQVPALERK